MSVLFIAAGCDQADEPPPPDISGFYEGQVLDGRTAVNVSFRLAATADGDGYEVDGYCRAGAFDGRLACTGACRLTTALRPSASGRTRFSLRAEPGLPGTLSGDTGVTDVSLDLTASPTGARLGGTANVTCTMPFEQATITHSDLPFSLVRLEGL